MKTIAILLMLISLGANSAEYRLQVDNSNYKGSILVKPYQDPAAITCESPDILNEAKTACYNPFDSISWVLKGEDTCNGIRQANFDPNIYFVRSNTANEKANLAIPEGFHWVTRNEYRTLYSDSTVENKTDASIFVYKDQCGITSPYLGSTWQGSLIFSDTGGVYYGHTEASSGNNNTYNYAGGMLGYVLYKD